MRELLPGIVLFFGLCADALLKTSHLMRSTTPHIDEKTIFLLSVLSLLYFGFLLLNAEYFHFQNIALGIIGELLTIPFIIGQFILLYFAWKEFRLRGYSIKTYAFTSMIISVGLICFIIAVFLVG